MIQLIVNRFSTIEETFKDKFLTLHLVMRESLFNGYDLDNTVVSSHSSLVEAMVSFLTDGEPSFSQSIHSVTNEMNQSILNANIEVKKHFQENCFKNRSFFSEIWKRISFLDNKSIVELISEADEFIQELNSSNLKTFNSVIFVLDFLSEVVQGKPFEVINSYFQLLENTLGAANDDTGQETRFRKNMKKLKINSDLIQIINNFLYYKVAIKSLNELYSIENIHDKLIKCVNRKEKDIPFEIIDLKIDFLQTHIVQSLTATSLMSKDFLLQFSRKNWKMIFSLISEFKNLLKYHQVHNVEEERDIQIAQSFSKLEKALEDILKNCVHVVNLREKGIVSELIISLNEYFLVPETQFSSQKIVAVYIEMINILNEIDAKQTIEHPQAKNVQTMDHFKFSVFAIQTFIKHVIDFPSLNKYLIYNILHLILIKINIEGMTKYETQIIFNSLNILAKSKVIEIDKIDRINPEHGQNQSDSVRNIDFFDIYSKILITNLRSIQNKGLLKTIWFKFLKTSFSLYTYLTSDIQLADFGMEVLKMTKTVLQSMLNLKLLSKNRLRLIKKNADKLYGESKEMVRKDCSEAYSLHLFS